MRNILRPAVTSAFLIRSSLSSSGRPYLAFLDMIRASLHRAARLPLGLPEEPLGSTENTGRPYIRYLVPYQITRNAPGPHDST